MYRKNILCPHCGYSFTGGFSSQFSGIGSLLGVPYMRCGDCKKLCETGKLAWSQMNFFGKFMEITAATVKTFFTGVIFALGIGFVIVLLFQLEPNAMETYRSLVGYSSFILGQAIAAFRTFWLYKEVIPEIERITSEKKWDEWIIG